MVAPPNIRTDWADGFGQVLTADELNSVGAAVNTAIYPDARAQTKIGSFTAPLLDKGGRVYNVKAFGAVGDGVADDTAAIQAAIDFATGTTNPVTTKRIATGTILLPAGKFKVQTDALVIRSAESFHMTGIAPWLTQLRVNGSGAAGLLIDGVAHGVFENFSVFADSGTVTSGIDLRWGGTSTSLRSTFANTFRKVHVAYAGGDYVYGFGVGINDNSLQNDGNSFYECWVDGRLSVGSGNVTTNQAGWRLGTGGAGNNLNHYFYNCSGGGTRYWIDAQKTNFFVFGTEVTSVDTVFNVTPYQNYYIAGGNIESSGQLINWLNGSSAIAQLTMEEIQFRPNNLQSDGVWMFIQNAGGSQLRNIWCYGTPPAGVVPVVKLGWGPHYLSGFKSLANPDNGGLVSAGVSAPGFWELTDWRQTNTAGQTIGVVGERKLHIVDGLGTTYSMLRDISGSATLVAGTAAVTFGTAEVQSLIATGASAGTFTLTYDLAITSALQWNSTAAQVQTALRALASIGGTNVTCTGGPLPNSAITITFSGALAGCLQRLITSTSSLTGGTAVVTRTTAGTGYTPEPDANYRIMMSGNAAETFSWASKTTTGFTINSSNAGSTATVDWRIVR